MFIACDAEPKNWKGYTLVVPAVSVGNVGQLTADLLISTLWMSKAGYFYDDCFLPIVGNDPFAHSNTSSSCNIMTGMELFESPGLKLLVLQQRSPYVKGRKALFIDKLMKWIEEGEFSQVIILTSSFAHERRDNQMTGSQFRYLLTPSLEEESGAVLKDNLHWVKLEHRDATQGSEAGGTEPEMDIFIPGGGIAKSLFEKCAAKNQPTAVLLLFCSEGDNSPDALELATRLNSWKNWIDSKTLTEKTGKDKIQGWKIPSSWSFMYGNKPSNILF